MNAGPAGGPGRTVWASGGAGCLTVAFSEAASSIPDAGSILSLSAWIKEDLRRRYAQGERVAVAEYLERFPELRGAHDRMISLVYEEFCLREEQGERPDPEQFCENYAPWRDSLLSQLRYHDAFSRLASTPGVSAQFPEPGERFRRFQLCAELGRGGVARVYLARDEDLGGRKLALKLSPDRGEEPSIQGRLDHPHIVAVTHVEREPETGLRGLCMPYWPGLALDKVIFRLDPASRRPRGARALWEALGAPEEEEEREIEAVGRPAWADFPRRGSFADAVAWFGLKLAEALAHAHARDIVHRDIKPANILLTRRGGPLLLDFNLAQGPSDAEEVDAAARGGTLPYMAPEQLRAFLDPDGWDAVGPGVDLYALGLVLRELLTGQRPPAPTPGLSTPRAVAELIDLRQAGPLPPVHASDRAVPHALDAILARCLAVDPADRYADAAALAEDLGRFLARRPLRHAINPSRCERTFFWFRRNRVRVASVVLPALVLLGSWGLTARARLDVDAKSWVNLGAVAGQHQRYDLAIQRYQQALREDPGLPEAHEGLGLAYFKSGRYRESWAHYGQAIALAMRSHRAPPGKLANLHRNRANAAYLLGLECNKAAVAQFHEAGQTITAEVSRLAEEADAHYSAALAPLQEARRLSGPSEDLRINLLEGWVWLGRGDVAALAQRPAISFQYYRDAKDLAEAVAADRDPHGRDEARYLLASLQVRIQELALNIPD